MRGLAMLLLGMAIGAFAAVTLVGAMRQATPLRKGIMAVSERQLVELRKLAAGERCEPMAAASRLQVLRGLGDDFEAALLPSGRDDAQFRRHLAHYLGTVDRAEASNVSLPTGKFRCSSVLIISMPTAPVAPTTATCGLRFIIVKGRPV